MQTEYESSSTPSQANHSIHLSPVKSIATSELPSGISNASLAGLVAVIFATLIGSLMVSPSPTAISESEEIESLTSASTETSPIVIAEVETTSTETPTATVSDPDVAETETTVDTTDPDVAETETTAETIPVSDPDIAETETTADTTADTTVDTTAETAPVSNTSVATETTAETAPESEVEASTSDTTETPAESEPTASVDVETSQLPVDIDPAGTSSSQPDTLNRAEEAQESEITASTPETTTEETITAAATSEVNTTELNQSLYNQIDSTWSNPVDGESVYVVKLNSEGEILGYEPQSQIAKNNVENTPLPTLVKSDATSTETAAEFRVVFSTSGILEVENVESAQ